MYPAITHICLYNNSGYLRYFSRELRNLERMKSMMVMIMMITDDVDEDCNDSKYNNSRAATFFMQLEISMGISFSLADERKSFKSPQKLSD